MSDDIPAVKRLAEHLQQVPRVAATVGRDDVAEDSWAITKGLNDIQRSAERIFQELVPALIMAPPKSSEAENLLYEIGEEYRHILYHLTATRFFGYLTDSTTEEDR
jgi:hypothetical protein